MLVEQKLNKLVPIIGGGIAFEICMYLLHGYGFMWYGPEANVRLVLSMFLSFLINYIGVLLFAKRAAIFDETTFLQALFTALLIATPIIVFSPAAVIFCLLFITQKWQVLDWSNLLPFFSIIFSVKYIMASIIAFIFSTRLDVLVGVTDEKELRLYGTTTQGVIIRKWKPRHVWLVRAEYYFNGRKYETRSQIDRSNTMAEKDVVTILYSTQNPYLSTINELTEQPIESNEQRNNH